VATTTTERASPSAPRSSSRNSPFPDQSDDRDVADRRARQHGEQCRLADAGAGKQAKPLAHAAGGEQVQRAHPQSDARAKTGTGGRLGWGSGDRPRHDARRHGAFAVHRAAQGIDHPAEPGVRHRDRSGTARQHDGWLSGPQAFEAAERQCLREALAKSDDFRLNRGAVTPAQHQLIADVDLSGQSGDLHDQSGNRRDPAVDGDRGDGSQPCVAYHHLFCEIILSHKYSNAPVCLMFLVCPKILKLSQRIFEKYTR